MCLSHYWIWNTRRLSNSRLLHHGRISFCEFSECKNSHTQHVQPLWLTHWICCFTEDSCGALAAGCIWLYSGLHWTFWERTSMSLERSLLQPPLLCVKGDKILPHYQWRLNVHKNYFQCYFHVINDCLIFINLILSLGTRLVQVSFCLMETWSLSMQQIVCNAFPVTSLNENEAKHVYVPMLIMFRSSSVSPDAKL